MIETTEVGEDGKPKVVRKSSRRPRPATAAEAPQTWPPWLPEVYASF